MAIWAYIFFFFSGCASLIYEVVWARQLMLLLGSTTYAITTVVVCFMLGLALGSHLAGAASPALRRPGRVYAGLETVIGLYALLVPVLMTAANPAYRALYPHAMDAPWLLTPLRFCVSALVLLVPTACMGATLPVMMTQLAQEGRSPGRSAGWLYGMNTVGATAGCALAGFWLMPALGLRGTTWVAAAMNLLIGLGGWMVFRGEAQTVEDRKAGKMPAPRKAAPRRAAAQSRLAGGERGKPARPAGWLPADAWALALAAAAISGLTSMVYQIAWTRALVMSIGSSTYAFTCILTAFILGLGLGSLAIARFADRLARPLAVLGLLELGIGLSAVLIVPLHGRIPPVVHELVVRHGQEYGTLLGLVFLLAVAVTVAPTLLMGAAFPLMARMAGERYSAPGQAVGRVYVVNTAGSVIGCILTGFVLIRGEALGARGSIAAAAVANAVLGVWLLYRARPAGWGLPGWGMAGGAVAAVLAVGAFSRWDPLLLTTAPFRTWERNTPREILLFREGVDTTVAVDREIGRPDILCLSVNGKPDASTDVHDVTTQLLLGHLPALLTPHGKQACVIGLGCGMTLDALARHPSYERLDCVEISEAVIEAARLFAPYTREILSEPRVRSIRADGRNHLLLTDRTYDLIISEPSNPWISGVSSLFTREFFELCKGRLNPDGRLAIWMQGYSMSRHDFQMVARTLCEVFEFVTLWQFLDTDYCFVAGGAPFRVPAGPLMRQYAQAPIRLDLYRAGIHDLGGVLGCFVSAGAALRDWAAAAPLHTDDNSRLEFSSPRSLYRDEYIEIGYELSRIQGWPFAEVLIDSPSDPAMDRLRGRVADVIAARRGLAEGMRQWKGQEPGRAFETLMEAYRHDPGNVAIYEMLNEFRDAPAGLQVGLAEPWAERIERLPAPVIASPRGASEAELVHLLVERAAAAREISAAVFFLRLAHDLTPDDGDILASLALETMHLEQWEEAERLLTGFLDMHADNGPANYAAAVLALHHQKADEAIERLRRALASGAVTAGQLLDDPAWTALKDHPAFPALLGKGAASQPAANGSPPAEPSRS